MRGKDIVHEKFCGSGQDQAAQAVDGHKKETEEENAFPRSQQGPDFGKRLPDFGGALLRFSDFLRVWFDVRVNAGGSCGLR